MSNNWNEPQPIRPLNPSEDYIRRVHRKKLGGAVSILCGVKNLDGCKLVDACKEEQYPWHWAIGMIEQVFEQLKREGWKIEPPRKSKGKKS